MSEEFLHFIWQYKYYNAISLKTLTGESVEVIHPGEPNMHAGPDFFNAKVKIDGTLWAGNVEVHISSSDWYVHEHHTDKFYDNVVLHAVYIADDTTYRSNGQPIPICKLDFSPKIWDDYKDLKNNKNWLLCADKLSQVSSFEFGMWMHRMLIEKFEKKAGEITRVLTQTINNWDETFYRMLFRSFGFGVNGEPFEMLSQSLPLGIVRKYIDSPFIIESLLFGQAGFLNGEEGDEYWHRLKNEYLFFKQKHQLQEIPGHLWKFLRLRPSNFPTIRISQLANLLCNIKGSFGRFMNTSSINDIVDLLKIETSGYWENHYRFGCQSGKKVKLLGGASRNLIVINTILPVLFCYARFKGDDGTEERVLDWLAELKPESNAILKEWKKCKKTVKNAADSQSLIYLSNNYCKKRKCLHCSIGHKVLTINSTQ